MSLRTLALRLDAPGILLLMNGSPPPDLAEGEDPQAGARRYAAAVSRLLDAAHPTAAVARLMHEWSASHPARSARMRPR